MGGMFYEGYGAELSIDGDVLILTKKGLGAKAIGNAGTRRIPLGALAGVNFKDATRLVNGYLQVVVGAESPGKAEASDPNTVLFRYKSQAQFVALRDYLLSAVEKNREFGVDPATVPYDLPTKTRLEARQERLREKQESYRKQREEIVQRHRDPGIDREDIADAAASMHRRLGGGREIVSKLPEHLTPGETVRKMALGSYREHLGIVVLTDSRLLFLFEGSVRRALEDFPLSVISSVSTRSRIATGDLRVFASGNEAVISNVVRADLEPIANALRQEIARIRSQDHRTRAEAPSVEIDPLSQIAKLAELRDQGILTDEEFDTKKAELLRRL